MMNKVLIITFLCCFTFSIRAVYYKLGEYPDGSYVKSVTVMKNIAYLADDALGLKILDISNPASPVLLGSYYTQGNAYSVSYGYGCNGRQTAPGVYFVRSKTNNDVCIRKVLKLN